MSVQVGKAGKLPRTLIEKELQMLKYPNNEFFFISLSHHSCLWYELLGQPLVPPQFTLLVLRSGERK